MKRSLRTRLCALLCITGVGLASITCGGAGPLPPVPGDVDARRPNVVFLPLGRVDLAGGNHLVPGVGLELDTRLGSVALASLWNSAEAHWRWSFETRLDASGFVDPSGARYALAAVADGQAIPGSTWRRIDASTVRSKGGLVHRFGSDGRLVEILWASAEYPKLRFDAAPVGGRLEVSAVEQCTAPASCQALFWIDRDPAGRVVGIRDHAGRAVAYTWNAAGELVEAWDPVAVAHASAGFRYEYAGGALAAVTNPENERIELAYQEGRLTRLVQVGEEAPTWQLVHHPPGSNGIAGTSLIDPLGQHFASRFDARGHLLESSSPSGEVTRTEWTGERPSRVIDAAGVETRLRFSDDDPVEVTLANGNTLQVTYAPAAEDREHPWSTPVQELRDALGRRLAQAFDTAGRRVGWTNGAGETWRFAYGPLGELSETESPAGSRLERLATGEHGHPTQLRRALGATALAYDAVGNLEVGPEGRGDFGTLAGGVVARRFDEARRLVDETLLDQPLAGGAAAPAHVVWTLRSDGRPLAIARPYGGETRFRYDAIGRLVERTDGPPGTARRTTFESDALGRVTRAERANGMAVELDYTPEGRVGARRLLRDGRIEASASAEWRDGRLVEIREATRPGPERFEYDAAGALARITFPDGESLEQSVDLRGRVTAEVYRLPGAPAPLRTLGFQYDGADRRVALLDEGAPVASWLRRGGRIEEVAYGNGLLRSFRYVPGDDALEQIHSETLGGHVVEDTAITWTAFSNALILSSARRLEGVDQRSLYVVASADPAGGGARVQQGLDPAAGGIEQFGFDALGNLTALAGDAGTQALSYDASHELLAASDGARGHHDYAWDAAGFAVARDGVPIEWAGDGQLRAVGDALRIDRDALGRPLSVTLAGERRRMRFGGRVAEDASGRPRWLELGEAEVDLATGERRYRHRDFRGNLAFLTDSAAQVVAQARYSAFGVADASGLQPFDPGFALGLRVGELWWLGARLYDPTAGRFLAPDPVLQAASQYAYAFANPVVFWDPDGAMPEAATWAATGIAISGAAVGALIGGVPGLVVLGAAVGFAVGAFTAEPPQTAAVSLGIGAVFGPAVVPLGSFAGGVLAGVGFQSAFTGGPMSGDGPPGGPSGDPPSQGDPPRPGGGGPQQFRIVEIHAEAPGGGTPGGFGCSVVDPSAPAPPSAWLWAALAAQAACGAWLVTSRRSGRSPSKGGARCESSTS